jgi:thiamine-monophosphate kinase
MSEQGEKKTEIHQIGEFGLIERLTSGIKSQNPSTVYGVGDDAAVLRQREKDILISTDLLIEGVHFDLTYCPLKHLGYKAVAVNLSDIYGMNGKPEQITISLGLSSRFPVEAVEELYEGARLGCKIYGVDLVGGDTTSSHSGLIISVTAIGSVQEEEVCYRNGAQINDLICVTGDLGAAYLGLQLLEREKQVFMKTPGVQPDLAGKDYLVGRQLKPEPRADIIDFLAKEKILPTSMMDLSDGLSSDLRHISEASGVGFHIFEAHVPIAQDTYNQALEFNLDPITCALHGGEDYELLFTIHPGDAGKITETSDITVIGEVVSKDKGLHMETKAGKMVNLIAQGWRHFDAEN